MLIKTLHEAIEAGAKQLKYYYDKEFKISEKEGINNLVTEADKASEKAIIEVIKKHFPTHQILSEEIGNIPTDSEYKWIIDPIDGTVNFAHHIPFCAVSIGIEKNGEIIAGVVYAPLLNEYYFAEKNKGALLNEKSIAVSKKQEVAKACLCTGFPYKYVNTPNGPLDVFNRFIKQGIPVRRFGAAAIDLCWVAAGRLDGFWEYNLSPWDSAAGYLIVEESGGKVTNFKGEKYTPYSSFILATNGMIHQPMLENINQIEL